MILIGVAGGTGSGKTTVVRKIAEALPLSNISVVSQDAYYKDNSHISEAERKLINFDHPDSIEWPLLVEHLKALKAGESIQKPIYSFITSTRSEETELIESKQVVIVEGILVLTQKEIRSLCNIKLFVDASPDERLIRVISRDISERSRSVEEVLDRYMKTVKPMHEQFIEPSKRYADIIIPQGGQNKVAIDIVASSILNKLS